MGLDRLSHAACVWPLRHELQLTANSFLMEVTSQLFDVKNIFVIQHRTSAGWAGWADGVAMSVHTDTDLNRRCPLYNGRQGFSSYDIQISLSRKDLTDVIDVAILIQQTYAI